MKPSQRSKPHDHGQTHSRCSGRRGREYRLLAGIPDRGRRLVWTRTAGGIATSRIAPSVASARGVRDGTTGFGLSPLERAHHWHRFTRDFSGRRLDHPAGRQTLESRNPGSHRPVADQRANHGRAGPGDQPGRTDGSRTPNQSRRAFALRKTASHIDSVSRPVCVFCRLG